MNTETITPSENRSVINSFGSAIPAGSDLSTVLTKADLNWCVVEEGVGGMDTGITMPRKKLLSRSDTQLALGIVGKDYVATDPAEFVSSQMDFATSLGGHVGQMGFIEQKSKAFAFVKIPFDFEIPRKDRQVGDPISAYIYSTDGWDGCTPRQSRLYLENLTCKNGMVSRKLIGDQLFVSHTKSFTSKHSERWKTFFTSLQEQLDGIRFSFNLLAKKRMTVDQMAEFSERVFVGESTRKASVREEVVGLFQSGTGNEGRTRWDAYNAVTEYLTHRRTFRKTEITDPETNRFLAVIESSENTLEKAFNLLLN